MFFCSNYNDLETLNDEQFSLVIKQIIDIERESSFLDYKKEIHNNNAELIKDLISLANNIEEKDGLLIFGVKDKELFGVNQVKFEEFIVGLLEGNRKKFASQKIPKIYIRTTVLSGKKLEIIIVKNSINTPFYLIEEYKCKNENNEKEVIIKPYEIYTRNLSNKGLAFDYEIEKLWAKRFGLNKTSLDKFFALDNDAWEFINKNSKHYNKKYVFNATNPEYVIHFKEAKGLHNYPYSHVLNIFNGYERHYKGKLQILFHSVVIFEDVYYFMIDCEYEEEKQRYLPKYRKIVTTAMKYYLLDTIQGKLIRILNKGKLNFHNGRKSIEYGHYLVFYNDRDLEAFIEFIIKYLKLNFKLRDNNFHVIGDIDFRINELFSCDGYKKCYHKYVEVVKSGDISILPQNFQRLLDEKAYLLTDNSNNSELFRILEKAYQFQLYLQWRNITEIEYVEFVENMQ